jgi:hypothetical protein
MRSTTTSQLHPERGPPGQTAHNRGPSRIGDVTGIAAVRARPRREVTLDQVPGPPGGRVGDRRGAPPLPAAALEPGGAHQPGDPPLPAGDVLAAQGLVHPRRPVGALRLAVNLRDLRGQHGIGRSPRGRAAGPALVVGGTGDLQQAARASDAVTCSLFRLDEGAAPHRVSLAKKPSPASGPRRPRAATGSPAAAAPAPPAHRRSAPAAPRHPPGPGPPRPAPRSRSGRSPSRPARSCGHPPGTAP